MDDDVKRKFFEIYDAIETDEVKKVLLQNKDYVYTYLDVLNQIHESTPDVKIIKKYFETSANVFEKECAQIADTVSKSFHLVYAVLFDPIIGWAAVVKYIKTMKDKNPIYPESRIAFFISVMITHLMMAITVESLQDYSSWMMSVLEAFESKCNYKLTGYDLILIIFMSSFIGEE